MQLCLIGVKIVKCRETFLYGPFPASFPSFSSFQRLSENKCFFIKMLMEGFEPGSSSIGSDLSANCATTTVPLSSPVWPVKNRQMSLKVVQNDFTRKIKDFDTFIKFAYECRRFGQINCCQRIWKVVKSLINRPIWSHWP